MNLHNIIDEIEKIDPEVYDRLDGRRDAVRKMSRFAGKVAVAAVPIALGSMFKKSYGQSVSTEILDVLNFALTLEHLEAGFYNKGLATHGLVPYNKDRKSIETIASHENAHVKFLTKVISTLGGIPVKKSKYDFTAQGNFPTVFSNYETFLAVAQTFEDTGVRAYKGQAGNLIENNDILTAALQIHSVEARHASHLRTMRWVYFGANVQPWITLNQSGIPSAAVQKSYNGEDLTSQAGINIVNINNFKISAEAASAAFDEPLSKMEIMDIVKPFFVV